MCPELITNDVVGGFKGSMEQTRSVPDGLGGDIDEVEEEPINSVC